MIGVNLSEPPEQVRAYVTEMNLTFPIVIDTSGELAATYGVRFHPAHFLIDRSGIVRAGGFGARDWNEPVAHAAVQALLKTTPAKPGDHRSGRILPEKGRTE